MFEHKDDDKHKEAKQQVLPASEVRRFISAAEEIDAHIDERKADRHHDRTGHDRREKLAQRPDAEAERTLKYAAYDTCAHQRAIGKHAGVRVL